MHKRVLIPLLIVLMVGANAHLFGMLGRDAWQCPVAQTASWWGGSDDPTFGRTAGFGRTSNPGITAETLPIRADRPEITVAAVELPQAWGTVRFRLEPESTFALAPAAVNNSWLAQALESLALPLDGWALDGATTAIGPPIWLDDAIAQRGGMEAATWNQSFDDLVWQHVSRGEVLEWDDGLALSLRGELYQFGLGQGMLESWWAMDSWGRHHVVRPGHFSDQDMTAFVLAGTARLEHPRPTDLRIGVWCDDRPGVQQFT